MSYWLQKACFIDWEEKHSFKEGRLIFSLKTCFKWIGKRETQSYKEESSCCAKGEKTCFQGQKICLQSDQKKHSFREKYSFSFKKDLFWSVIKETVSSRIKHIFFSNYNLFTKSQCLKKQDLCQLKLAWLEWLKWNTVLQGGKKWFVVKKKNLFW